MESSSSLVEESMISLPIVETQCGNILAYIPTKSNFSITNGQILISWIKNYH